MLCWRVRAEVAVDGLVPTVANAMLCWSGSAPIEIALRLLPALAEADGDSELVRAQAARLALVATRNHGGVECPALPLELAADLSAAEYLSAHSAELLAAARRALEPASSGC